MKSKIEFPKVMCTQHPDSVSKYISTQEEITEAVEAVTKYGCDEYMPDYEGKTTPYHQNVQIVSQLIEETELIPGRDVSITPRAPSAFHENRFRQLMVMMSVAEANYSAYEYSDSQAISELVHPMTSTIKEIVEAQQHMIDVSELAKKEFKFEMEPPRIIPLIEDVPGLLNAKDIIANTILSYQNHLNDKLERYRIFIGKSDSALTFGHVASTLSCKYAISSLHELEKNFDTKIGIIFGGGSLPFRGHVSLENADNFFEEFRGIDTLTLQSGIRYDHEEGNAENLVRHARNKLSRSPDELSNDEKEELVNIIALFGARYNRAMKSISSVINNISDFLPQQRDRLTRGGKTGYSRDAPDITEISGVCRSDIKKELECSMPEKNLDLPRAIKFTGAFYSIGLPPEIIGTGCAIADVREKMGENACERLLTKYFPSLQTDLEFAFDYLNMSAASKFLSKDFMECVSKDVDILREIFDLNKECDPSYGILMDMVPPGVLLAENCAIDTDQELLQLTRSTLYKMGKIRKSLG
ncbi:phosphoenolpyruvate carboxylase [Methanolobus bombayensis]|uniref:phosphoenolpyruvate carboxylase n=1 Tax=Methanolobus bombayensis TaxID=38023 RepID=UPI001AE60292|nr:phosphoenolpyruvate carboxylase [Methanolobus bombayensis]MBP1908939.1 phosphoenolpyruvate carboxylase [Methanolobus bombayensis]